MTILHPNELLQQGDRKVHCMGPLCGWWELFITEIIRVGWLLLFDPGNSPGPDLGIITYQPGIDFLKTQ